MPRLHLPLVYCVVLSSIATRILGAHIRSGCEPLLWHRSSPSTSRKGQRALAGLFSCIGYQSPSGLSTPTVVPLPNRDAFIPGLMRGECFEALDSALT